MYGGFCCQHYIKCIYNRLMQCFLTYCRGILAEFLSVVNSACASPHNLFLAKACPCDSFIFWTAFIAPEYIRQCVFTAIFWFCSLPATRYLMPVAPAWHFILHDIEHRWFNNRHMMIFYQILRKLSCILYWFFGEYIGNVGFLYKDITFIFFVSQYMSHRWLMPFCISLNRLDALFFKVIAYAVDTLSIQESCVYVYHYFCFFGNYFGFAVRSFSVSEEASVHHRNLSDLIPFTPTIFYIITDWFAFCLREHGI